MKKLLSGLLSGLLFGAGLAISGMTDTQKILGFLDVFGAWDLSLMFVMAAGLMISVPSYIYIKKRNKACFDSELHLPNPSSPIDKTLLIGATSFGIGWGLYGFCPGPAIASLSYGDIHSVYFLIAMFVGMALANQLNSE